MPVQRGEVYKLRLGDNEELHGLVVSVSSMSESIPFAVIAGVHSRSFFPSLELDQAVGVIRPWVLHTVRTDRFIGEPVDKLSASAMETVDSLLRSVLGLGAP